MVGAPGSGKSTIAKTLVKNLDKTVIVSSDEIRKELFGDLIQGNASEVFKVCHDRILFCVKNGYNVIFDATNISRKKRTAFYRKMKKYAFVENYFVLEPLEKILEQNRQREGLERVPEDVIKRMYMSMDPPRVTVDCDSFVVHGNIKEFTDEIKENIQEKHESPYHKETIIAHILACFQLADTDTLKEIALFHDLGKSVSRTAREGTDFQKENGLHMSYFGHEKVSCAYYMLYNKDTIAEDKRQQDILEVINLHLLAHSEISQKVINKNHLTESVIDLLKRFAEIDNKCRMV